MDTVYLMVGEESFEEASSVARVLWEELGIRARIVYVPGIGKRIIVNGFEARTGSEEVIELAVLAALINGNLEHLVLACCA